MKSAFSLVSHKRYAYAALTLLCSLLAVAAHAGTVVAPSATEGNTSIIGVYDSGAYTLQWVYSSSLLSDIPIGAQITGIQYRRNGGGTTATTNTVFSDYEIYMSSSTAAPGSLSTNFANNEGSDRVQVRDGALTVFANTYTGGSTPNAWAPVITFSTPYTYTGNDLLITVRHSASTGSSLANADGVSGVSTVDYVSSSGSQTATTGTHSTNFGVTAQLTYAVVPEANTTLFVASALPLLGVIVAARRRK